MHPEQRIARGFTIIEVLVASVVAAMLMAGVLMVVTLVIRDRKKLAPAVNVATRAQPVIDLLRRDLLNARSFNQSPGGADLVLMGYGGLDAQTLAPNGRPVKVEYDLEIRGAKPWLVRRQTYLDETTPSSPFVEMVSGEISGMAIEPVEAPDAAQTAALNNANAATGSSAAANQWPQMSATSGPIPAVMRLWLKVQGSQETVLQSQVLTR